MPRPCGGDLDQVDRVAIPLSEFTARGVNVAGITDMYIGAGDRDAPKAGGIGSLFIDDIRLIRSVR